ncbi:MAG TPA: PQ-loop repeat-containing protein [Actinomycetota bacterium]|nr:PQ-loop repeat-containing protein [Actinomycetota bacterium]
MFEVLGLAGVALSVAAYVPQVAHLGREHCSEGVSERAWAMWLIGGLLIGVMAVRHGDAMFVMVQAGSITSSAIILGLAHRYRGMRCASHVRTVILPDPPERSAEYAVPLTPGSRDDGHRRAA